MIAALRIGFSEIEARNTLAFLESGSLSTVHTEEWVHTNCFLGFDFNVCAVARTKPRARVG